MIVYHGSSEIVRRPDVHHSYRALGQTKGRSDRRYIYGYQYRMSGNTSGLLVKTFSDDLTEWSDFVCDCRDEKTVYQQFDLIIGKVANDKVFRVVDMYHSGIWDRERALKEIRAYPDYDQIAFVSQKAVDQLLKFDRCWEV